MDAKPKDTNFKLRSSNRYRENSFSDSNHDVRFTKYERKINQERSENNLKYKSKKCASGERDSGFHQTFIPALVKQYYKQKSKSLKSSPFSRPSHTNVEFDVNLPRDSSPDRGTIYSNVSTGRNKFRNNELDKVVLNWKLVFNGSDEQSADNFLTQIEDRRKLTQVSDEELLLSMPILLNKIARKWFKNHENK